MKITKKIAVVAAAVMMALSMATTASAEVASDINTDVSVETNSAKSISFPLAEYPAGAYGNGALSYFTNNGSACSTHYSGLGSNCKYFDGGWQCYAFANYIYYRTTGEYCSANTKTYFNLENQNANSLKGYLRGLPTGTHLRVVTQSGGPHSMAVMNTSAQGITVYHANYDCRCGVYYDTYTWAEYAKKYPGLTYYVIA